MTPATSGANGEGSAKPKIRGMKAAASAAAVNDGKVQSPTDQEILRKMIQHEDDLRNQRLGYYLTLNGFLFAGVGFAWKMSSERALVIVFAAAGMLMALSTLVAMRLSTAAIAYLRGRDPASIKGHSPDPNMSIPVAVSSLQFGDDHFKFLQPWIALPAIVGLTWLAVLVTGCVY